MSKIPDAPETRPLRVRGEAAGATNPLVSLIERLVVGDGPVILELSELRISDEFAVTQCVNALRELLVRGAHVVLVRAPERLVDGISRAGLLGAPSALTIESRA